MTTYLIIHQVIDEILRAKAAQQGRKGIVFAWWGSHAQNLKKVVEDLNAVHQVPVEHIDHCNPANMGDAFCNGNHFQVIAGIASLPTTTTTTNPLPPP